MNDRARTVRFVGWGAMVWRTDLTREPSISGPEMQSDGQGVVRGKVMSLASYLAAPPRGREMSGVYLSVPPSPCQGEAAAQNRSRERTHGDEYAGEAPTNQPTGGTMCPR